MTEKIIFLDIDGTLLNTGGAGQRAMERALTAEFQIDFPFEGVLTAGRTDRGITDEILERYSFDNTAENRARFREAYLAQLPMSLTDSPGLLLPKIRELLERLTQHRHVTLSLLTGNYAEGAWIKLRHYQLDDFFRFGGFGDDDANRNDVAQAAMRVASTELDRAVDGSETLVIGDTPADIHCAQAIGAKCVAVATGVYSSGELKPHNPDHLFED
ncbi:MAG: HAD hydrolase-like protein, partial [Fuerstiella sp.]|nr:HAD hydrolase-like protein [Fuerstiella sp.]